MTMASLNLFLSTTLLSLLFICNIIIPFTCSISGQKPTKCRVEEKLALLHFRESFIMSDDCYDPLAYNSKFASWKIHDDCCSWNGVDCKDENYVVSLDLGSSCLFGSINSNSTLFRLFHLRRLNLANNDFNSSLIPKQIGHLKMLTHLNLSFSGFSGQIPSQISNLSNLVSLDLSMNTDLKLHELGLANLVRSLSSLEQLHLSSVDISSEVPELLANISSLKSLLLPQCGLTGEFPSGIFQLPNLKNLDIRENSDLRGYLPHFHGGTPLVSLKLSENKFVGEIPSSIGNLGKLEHLEISSCKFTGQLPSSLGNLSNLSLLDLSNNSFSGHSDSLTWFGKLTNLNTLNLYGMNLNGNIPSSLANLTQLSYLDLGYSNLTGTIPHWLVNLTELAYIFLDHNHLSGDISPGLIYGDSVEILFMGSNQLSGRIPSVNNSNSPIFHLDLSSNRFEGTIPTSISKLKELVLLELHSNNLAGEVDMNMFFQLTNLMVLSLSFNNLRLLSPKIALATKVQSFSFLGLASCNITEVPSFLQHQDELQFLDLSSNNIHGELPSWVWNISRNSLEFMNLSYNALSGFEQSPHPVVLQWAHLQVLDLRSNLLQGSLPVPASYSKQLRHVCKLRMINLSQNQIRGELPRSLSNCKDLELLDFGNNEFSDTFPSWLGVVPGLRVLILRSNYLFGVIWGDEMSAQFSKLQIIDLSHNNLTGTLPAIYFENWSAMKAANGSHIRYMGKNQEFTPSVYYTNYDYSIKMSNKGLEMEYLKIPSALAAIDFSDNRFQGEIPDSIRNLTGLRLLNLSGNILTGQIPSSLANVKELECLDLSINKIKGNIPPQLVQLTFLSSFNVSYNQLEGPIPRGNQFNTFEESSYQGNLELCGVPLKKKCGIADGPASTSSGFSYEFGWQVVMMGYGSGFIIGAVVGHIFTRKRQGWFGRKQPKRRQRCPRNHNRD